MVKVLAGGYIMAKFGPYTLFNQDSNYKFGGAFLLSKKGQLIK